MADCALAREPVTIYRLGREPVFPPASEAEPSGLLAVGGDLESPRLLAAYAAGIFPWYEDPQPILWFSPDPRWLLLPRELHVSRRLARRLRARHFSVTLDRAFGQVIRNCARIRRADSDGTWITPAMQAAYEELFEQGFAPVARRLGWRPEFRWERLARWAECHGGMRVLERRPMPPFGHFSLIRFERLAPGASGRDAAAGDGQRYA